MGTSYSVGYVSGTLAFFYGVEGKDMTPTKAAERLAQNADNYMEFPDGTDWKESPNILANIGYLKGQQQDPKMPYLGAPPDDNSGSVALCTYGADPGIYTGSGGYCQCGTALYPTQPATYTFTISGTTTVLTTPCGYTATPSSTFDASNTIVHTVTSTTTFIPSASPTSGCQSPNYNSPLGTFTLDRGKVAVGDFPGKCQIEFQPGKAEGSTLYFNPCSQEFGGKAVDVILSVQQWTWAAGVTSTWPDVQEMTNAALEIMNNCDTTTVTAKWGGLKTVITASGVRLYNVFANQDHQYPAINNKFKAISVISGGGNCETWGSS